MAAAAGCSSDFTRFDQSLYTGSAEPVADQSANPYPGDVDATTTASVGGRARVPAPHPLTDVSPRPVVPDHAGYQPSATGYASQYPAQDYAAAPANPGTYQPRPAGTGRPAPSGQAVHRSDLPRLAPPSAQAANTDRFTTAAIAPANAPAAATRAPVQGAGSERGWTATGGTTVTVRGGETIYNLSKRYGVPVKEILKVNNISDPAQVQAGQNIVIPTYVYARGVPVSAPDNNPATRYASAGRGSLYTPKGGNVPVPQPAPIRMAAADDGAGQESRHPGQAPMQENALPDRSITTGSIRAGSTTGGAAGGRYEVSGGDTLSRIAARHNVSVSDLRAANNLSGDTIRVGQKLVIPSASAQLASAVPAGVDPIVTGSADNGSPRPYTKPGDKDAPRRVASSAVTAPARTGIDEFRWPVRGRVIANFGDKTETGRNDGIDISVPEGTAVKAIENGVVVYSGSELEGFGNLVLIRHQDGWVSAYAHNKILEVKRGDEVRRGEIVARSGRTGNAEMPKLHFELRKNSVPVDPLKHFGGA